MHGCCVFVTVMGQWSGAVMGHDLKNQAQLPPPQQGATNGPFHSQYIPALQSRSESEHKKQSRSIS